MGGLKPGAGSALANAAGANAGAVRGTSTDAVSSGQTANATEWQSWQSLQVLWQSGEADASWWALCVVAAWRSGLSCIECPSAAMVCAA